MVKYVSGTKTLPIAYVLSVLKNFSKYPGEGVSILCIYGKPDLKSIGSSMHLPCTMQCKLKGTEELKMLYRVQPDSVPVWIMEDHSLSKVASKTILNMFFSSLWSPLAKMRQRPIRY